MLYNLRTTFRGGGARDLETYFGKPDVGGGVFQTDVGVTGQTVIIWPREGVDSYGALRNQAERGRGAMGVDSYGMHALEVLKLAPFMEPLQPQQIGRVWELGWYDFPPGAVEQGLEAIKSALPHRQEYSPVVGCWSVEVGPKEDRIYLLSAFKDWDDRDRVMGELRKDPAWPPQAKVPATAGGSKLLTPARYSPLR